MIRRVYRDDPDPDRFRAEAAGRAAQAPAPAAERPPAVPARPTPTDSIERAPDLGPFAIRTAASSVAPAVLPGTPPAGPETVSVGSLAEPSIGRSPTPAVSPRAEAWSTSADGDRAVVRLPRARTASPETVGADGAALGPEAETEVQATAEVGETATPSTVSDSAAYVGEAPVEAAWLAEREAALVATRADFEAARAQALAAPGVGPVWQTTVPITDDNGQVSSASGQLPVWLGDPNGAQELIGWSEGEASYRPVGRWVEFDEAAFAAHYRASGSEPLQRLAALYDPTGRTDAAALLGAQPEVWSLATADHALNAGPPPRAGVAMAPAGQLGTLDLYLADPQITALIDAYGGNPAPATGGIAIEQARLFGEGRFEQMTRLANAMSAVRARYTDAMVQARNQGVGPGWVDRPRTYVVSDEFGGATSTATVYVTDENGRIETDAAGQPVPVTEHVFDPDAFTDSYLGQGGLANQAFAALYGRSHTQFGSTEEGRTIAVSTTFDNPNWSMSDSAVFGHRDLLSLDPNDPPELNDGRGVAFDFEAGWATPYGNLHQDHDWFETVVQVAFVAAVCYVSAGTLGSVAAEAVAGYGAAASAAASAAAVGAAGSVASGMLSGNLTLRSVLQGALSGALTAGLMNSELAQTVNAAGGTAGTIALRVTVQGGIQTLMHGSFRDGACAAFAAGLAEEAGTNLRAGIDKAVAEGTMSASEAIAARTFARVLGSAIRAAGDPNDPRHAFASDFLSETLRQVQPPAVTGTSAVAPTPSELHDESALAPDLGDAPATTSPAEPTQPAGDPAPLPEPARAAPVPVGDPFLTVSDDDDPSLRESLAEQMGIPRDDLVDAGWLDDSRRELGRSRDVLRGFIEGAGFSVLDVGKALLEIAESPRQFIRGMNLLLTSADARAQLGEEMVTRVRADVLLLESAWAADDMRGVGQQLGKLTADFAQVVGGVEALARLGVSTASAGGRLLLRGTDAAASARIAEGALPESMIRPGWINDVAGPGSGDVIAAIREAREAAALQAAERLRSVTLASTEADSLIGTLASSSTRGSGNRVVLGRSVNGELVNGSNAGYVMEGVERGGIYFESPSGVYEALGSKELVWAVNERFLVNQMRAGVARIDFVGESVAYVEASAVGSARWREIQFLRANASSFGYELRGNGWVKVGN